MGNQKVISVITKTEAVYKIIESKGRFFGITYGNGFGEKVDVNGQFTNRETQSRNIDRIYGHTNIHDIKKNRTKSGRKARRRINNRKITRLNINNQQFIVRG